MLLLLTSMNAVAAATVEVAEAAYDLQLDPEQWLPNLLERGALLFDRGLGCAAAIWAGQRDGQGPWVAQTSVHGGPSELARSFTKAIRTVGAEVQRTWPAKDASARAVSESELERPNTLWAFEKDVGCPDALGLGALDLELHGVGVGIPSPRLISLTKDGRMRWQRIAAHIEAGHRLRRRLGCAVGSGGERLRTIPSEGTAVIEPRGFEVVHADGTAKSREVRESLREAAIRIDKSRSKQGRKDIEQALQIWHDLVRGRWSLVDWFESDGRRLIIAIPNDPGVADPRGLTKREHEVAKLAAAGETGKRIGYRLGISPQRVSALLNGAMHKLRVSTQAELVMKLRGFEVAETSSTM